MSVISFETRLPVHINSFSTRSVHMKFNFYYRILEKKHDIYLVKI